MKAAILTFLSCFILSLPACEKLPSPPEQEEQQEGQKHPEDNGQQNGKENTQSMTMNIIAGGKTADELKAFFGTSTISVTYSLKQ